MSVRLLNFEPTNFSAGGSIVKLDNEAEVQLGHIINDGRTVDQMVNLGFDNWNKVIWQLSNQGGTVNNKLVNITARPAESSFYFGPSSGIQNDAASATGLVSSMDTAGTGNG